MNDPHAHTFFTKPIDCGSLVLLTRLVFLLLMWDARGVQAGKGAWVHGTGYRYSIGVCEHGIWCFRLFT
jgi:hypothetical protein